VLVAHLGDMKLENNFTSQELDSDILDCMQLGIQEMRLESGVISESAITSFTKPDTCSSIECVSAILPLINLILELIRVIASGVSTKSSLTLP